MNCPRCGRHISVSDSWVYSTVDPHKIEVRIKCPGWLEGKDSGRCNYEAHLFVDIDEFKSMREYIKYGEYPIPAKKRTRRRRKNNYEGLLSNRGRRLYSSSAP